MRRLCVCKKKIHQPKKMTLRLLKTIAKTRNFKRNYSVISLLFIGIRRSFNAQPFGSITSQNWYTFAFTYHTATDTDTKESDWIVRLTCKMWPRRIKKKEVISGSIVCLEFVVSCANEFAVVCGKRIVCRTKYAKEKKRIGCAHLTKVFTNFKIHQWNS